MTTIDVIIPKGGRAEAPVEPILEPHYEAIPRNQMVAWRFCTEGEEDPSKNITMVEVRFVDSEAEFFPNVSAEEPKTRLRQHVIYRKNAEDPKAMSDGQSMIWGMAPNYSLAEDQSAEDKYIIEGLDADGQVVASIDPYIITTKPRPRP